MASKKAITTTNGLSLTSVTTAERNLIANNLTTNHGIIYNSDNRRFEYYQGRYGIDANWFAFPNGNIVGGESPTVANNIAIWDNTTGTLIKDSGVRVKLDNLNNFFIGYQGVIPTPTGQNNFGVGVEALASITSGQSNVAVGAALARVDTGGANVGVGFSAAQALLGGNDNVAVGASALALSQTGSNCVAVGTDALQRSLSDFNIGIGWGAGNLIQNGQKNTCVGALAGPTVENAGSSSNTFLGESATTGTTLITNATAIGADAVVNSSNSIVLGKGCSVGIGTSQPLFAIHLGTDNGVKPYAYFVSDTLPSNPTAVNDGIFSVNNGAPQFTSGIPSGAATGTIVTIAQDKTIGTYNYTGAGGAATAVINTTAVTGDSHIMLSCSLGNGGETPPMVSWSTVLPGDSFTINIPAGSNFTFRVNWVILDHII